MKDTYPSVYDFIVQCAEESKKKRRSSDLAILMQKYEGFFFHQALQGALKGLLDGDGYAIIHDAFYLPESKEKESLTLINRAVRGIYSMHTYTTSRLVMIVVLYMQGMLSKISKKDVSVFSNSGIRYNRNLYINGYIFQFMACILGTSLVRIYYSYRLRNFEFRTTTSKIRRKSNGNG